MLQIRTQNMNSSAGGHSHVPDHCGKMMELHKVDVGQPIQTVDDFLLYIFSTIDTDHGGNMLALLRSRWCIQTHLTSRTRAQAPSATPK